MVAKTKTKAIEITSDEAVEVSSSAGHHSSAELTRLTDYLRDGKYKHTHKGRPLLNHGYYDDFVVDGNNLCKLFGSKPEGIFHTINGKRILLINGDNRDETIEGAATISPVCIDQMMKWKLGQTWSKLSQGKLTEIVFLDIQPDSKKELTAAEKVKVRGDQYIATSRKKLKPQLGYTLVVLDGQKVWHRPSMVTFRDRQFNYYVMGQDEGTYFCCMLMKMPHRPKTLSVEAALRSLTPKGCEGCLRQGEWFAVPVDDKDVPQHPNFYEADDRIILPRDDDESNEHLLSGGYTRIGLDGKLYSKEWNLVHDEHADLSPTDVKKWYTFVRNTARRSVSQEGVD